MPKTIALHAKIEPSIRSVRVRNNESILSIKINKVWLLIWIRRLALIAVFIGYIFITYVCYSINTEHFWVLVKVGIILSMLLFIALSKS